MDARYAARERWVTEAETAEVRTAVLLPCQNEAGAIDGVIKAFHVALPAAAIYVYDNNSTDGTARVAAAAGAIVRSEPFQGKGNVVRRMFADVEADIYVLADGDGTYSAQHAPRMIELALRDGLEMVTADRVACADDAFRRGHRFGNWALTGMVSHLFGRRVGDMLSGYRVFSRRFVKSFPAMSSGFEIETELTVYALEMRMKTAEFATPYGSRAEGTKSKLRTYRDGMRIAMLILLLLKEERPFWLFGGLSALLVLMSLALGISVVTEFVDTGLVPRLPTAVLAASLMLLGTLLFTVGIVLDSIAHVRREMRRFHYLALSGPPHSR